MGQDLRGMAGCLITRRTGAAILNQSERSDLNNYVVYGRRRGFYRKYLIVGTVKEPASSNK